VSEVPEKTYFSRWRADAQATNAVGGRLIHSTAARAILLEPLHFNATVALNCLGSRSAPNAMPRSSMRSTFRAHGKPCPPTCERSRAVGLVGIRLESLGQQRGVAPPHVI
jgi:hypothetical protein